jgi:nucleotide-binding universal stress UspA family protein
MINSLLSRVLVPLDGSSNAEAILPLLRRFLPKRETSLTLLTSFTSPLDSRGEAERRLSKLADQLTQEGYPSSIVLRHGSAAESILKVASQEQTTLIAMTTHGRTGMARLVVGSVAEQVLQSTNIPVLVSRSFPPQGSREAPPLQPLRNILLPLDGSERALEVVEPVVRLAQGSDARVHLLRVEEITPNPGHWDIPDETMKKTDQLLREACIPTVMEHRRGIPTEEILASISKNGIDLLAMTTHGRSGPSRWILGSVTAEVLRHTTVPMLVVRRHARPSPEASLAGAPAEKNSSPTVDIPATPTP